jgi:hypothetical protein
VAAALMLERSAGALRLQVVLAVLAATCRFAALLAPMEWVALFHSHQVVVLHKVVHLRFVLVLL